MLQGKCWVGREGSTFTMNNHQHFLNIYEVGTKGQKLASSNTKSSCDLTSSIGRGLLFYYPFSQMDSSVLPFLLGAWRFFVCCLFKGEQGESVLFHPLGSLPRRQQQSGLPHGGQGPRYLNCPIFCLPGSTLARNWNWRLKLQDMGVAGIPRSILNAVPNTGPSAGFFR